LISLSSLQPEDPDFFSTAARFAQTLQRNHVDVISLDHLDVEKLETTQAVLKEHAIAWDGVEDEASLRPSKQLPGRDLYEYSLGQAMHQMPMSMQKTAPQVDKHCCA